jgi:flagellar biosynthetic protein FlhB
VADQGDRSSEDLTDEVSSYRLEEFREKGQVSQSRELTGLVVLLATGMTALSLGGDFAEKMVLYMREAFHADLSARMNFGSNDTTSAALMKALKLVATVGLPVSVVGFLVGIVSSFAQIGAIFSTDPITPDFSKIDPLKGIQRLLSMKQVIEGARLLLKAVVVLFVVYSLVKTEILGSAVHLDREALSIGYIMGQVTRSMFLSVMGVLFLFALIDFGLQKWEYRKSLRLTKQESKEEFKEREGDPQLKARVRAIQRDMARKRMMTAVKSADVIVTNPTHIAIAIVYEKDKMMAPKVVAKGADHLAERIKKIAAEAGIPLVENVPLARTLFKTVKVNQYVPRALYQAVAEILAYVYRLRNRKMF